MTTTLIQTHIARCIEVQQEIARLEAEEKQIKTLLAGEAARRTTEQAATDNGGWSWEHPDTDGNIVRVTQPAPKLKGRLDPEAKNFAKIREAAGRCFMELFRQVPAYQPVEEFRGKAELFLGKGANRLLKLVTTESPIQVAFEVKEVA